MGFPNTTLVLKRKTQLEQNNAKAKADASAYKPINLTTAVAKVKNDGSVQSDQPSYAGYAPLEAPKSSYTPGPVYQAQAYNNPDDAVQNTALNRRFDVLRAKTEGEANTQAQQAGDALQRAAAAHGQLGSGTLVKQQMLQQKGLEAQKTNNINNVESQREVGAAQIAKDQADKQFAFNQEEAGRAFQSGEAEKQRGFAANEADLQNKMQVDMSNRDAAFRDAQFSAQNDQFKQQMNMAIKQQNLDEEVTKFNESMAGKSVSQNKNGQWSVDTLEKDGWHGVYDRWSGGAITKARGKGKKSWEDWVY